MELSRTCQNSARMLSDNNLFGKDRLRHLLVSVKEISPQKIPPQQRRLHDLSGVWGKARNMHLSPIPNHGELAGRLQQSKE